MRPARPDATTSGSGSVEADGHQADETLEAIEQTGGGSLQHALVHRLRAYALMQKRDLDAAAEAVRQSLDVARRADETYELALTLEAGARLAEMRGDDALTRGEGGERAAGTARRRLDARSPAVAEARLSLSGRSAAWSARLLWEQEAGGSNPPVPIFSSDFCSDCEEIYGIFRS